MIEGLRAWIAAGPMPSLSITPSETTRRQQRKYAKSRRVRAQTCSEGLDEDVRVAGQLFHDLDAFPPLQVHGYRLLAIGI